MSQAVKEQESNKPQTIYLKDYQPPSHWIKETHLTVQIFDSETLVRSRLVIERNAARSGKPDLVLNGEHLELKEVKLNGQVLADSDYRLTETSLELPKTPDKFELETLVRIHPEQNKSLSGLYCSRGIFCTQCESHGFRRITYYLDRPDVLSRFTTTIEGDKLKLPQLLSNGNLVASEPLDGDRHRAVWEDPHLKPAYLFALVAGDLALVEDHFKTMSGRDVTLRIFVEHGNEDRTTHAMDSLKRSMKWDEEAYGREYDLDLFMIVAVDDFNFGAMENKGLNIFNSACILADKETATDGEFQGIEGVVAHEYFHNWTGNRITCRDWFQLTLKEGLTVFRDEEFSADMNSRPVKRINTARFLRDFQWVEDAGPNAHPIRPASYIEINNFYTTTVYQKGAAVIRMLHTLLGPEAYRRATDLYFQRHDGQAVTTDDFVACMEEASGLDLTQFKDTWYRQAGTPVCKVEMDWNEAAKEVTLTVEQSCPPTSECREKKPFYFPLALGFLNSKGQDISTACNGDAPSTTHILHIQKAKQSFTFKNISERPVPSLLRDFSAPVRLDYNYSAQDLALLLAHDSDPFNRYDAGQRLARMELQGLISGKSKQVSKETLDAFGRVLADAVSDPAFTAEALVLPTETSLVEAMPVANFEAAFEARESFKTQLAQHLESEFLDWYQKMGKHDPSSLTAEAMGMRRLRNVCLTYLAQIPGAKHLAKVKAQYDHALTMTEQYHALCLLCDTDTQERREALEEFYSRWHEDPLVMNKFFTAQACSKHPSVLKTVQGLEQHPAFDGKNPNKIRSLIGRFAGNLRWFHDTSGEGYRYLADKILEIDAFNSNVSGRLSTAFKKYAQLDSVRQAKMKVELERILAKDGLSGDVYEIVSKTLKAVA